VVVVATSLVGFVVFGIAGPVVGNVLGKELFDD
jgi:hypothetical protein